MELSLNGEAFARMISGGASLLYQNRKTVNELNVFPVPDGDTGDNMYMTISSYVKSEESSLFEVADIAAHSMLLGARGNSGVILSRIFAGLAKGFAGLSEAGSRDIENATNASVCEAYASVGDPKEGTMLTVYKDAVTYANSKLHECGALSDYMDCLIEMAEKSLDNTPELLPVLKDAGVVDSGGAGLVYIFQGMKNALLGGETEAFESKTERKTLDVSKFTEDSMISFGYCTEFILRLQSSKVNLSDFDENVIRRFLEGNGDSVVFFRDGSIIKVHVHTKRPGDILNYCQGFGEFLTLKIENMDLQNEETKQSTAFIPKKSKKKTGIVCVGAGQGVIDLFKEIGADYVVNGGQSMNPSSEDFIKAYQDVNAEKIFVFVNNTNIILSAKQSAEIYKESEIVIVPTENIGEGYMALSMFDAAYSSEELMESLKDIKTCMISRAIRDAKTDGIDVIKDSFVGFTGKQMLVCENDRNVCANALLDKLCAYNCGVIVVLYGLSVSESEAEMLKDALEMKYRQTEIIMQKGDQPIYDYIFILN